MAKGGEIINYLIDIPGYDPSFPEFINYFIDLFLIWDLSGQKKIEQALYIGHLSPGRFWKFFKYIR